MAKKEDKGKVRVIFFELEGTNETLLESIKSITGTINRSIDTTPRTVRLLTSTGETSDTVTADDIEEAIFADAEDETLPATSNGSKPKKSRRVTTPPVIEDLDFDGASVSLKDFVALKKPGDHNKKYLVIAAWLKEHRKIDEISASHIYTCYRFLGWSSPKDVGQILRNAKHSEYFVSGSSDGMFKLTHIGENRVREMN